MQSEQARQRKSERKRLEREARRRELRRALAEGYRAEVLVRGTQAWISLDMDRRPRERGVSEGSAIEEA